MSLDKTRVDVPRQLVVDRAGRDRTCMKCVSVSGSRGMTDRIGSTRCPKEARKQRQYRSSG